MCVCLRVRECPSSVVFKGLAEFSLRPAADVDDDDDDGGERAVKSDMPSSLGEHTC